MQAGLGRESSWPGEQPRANWCCPDTGDQCRACPADTGLAGVKTHKPPLWRVRIAVLHRFIPCHSWELPVCPQSSL